MPPRYSKQELLLVGMALLLGVAFRGLHADQLAIEHFDEGVYASSTWYDSQAGQPWPMRHLYAPPLLPKTIQILSAIPGLSSVAPFLPSMVLGSLTILLLWWLGRSMFGQSAGLLLVYVVGLSDFHILFSRMAMTDVPALFWISVAVGIGMKGLQSRSVRTMALAGLCAGIAWWTKYTGWLALAILLSGTGFWWILTGRREMSAVQLVKLLGSTVAVAVLVWLPWYLMLPWYLVLNDVGGYAAVAANHKAYLIGFSGWQDRLADHMLYHFRFDSWLGPASIGLGLLAAGTRRWMELKRSTWNASSAPAAGGRNHAAVAAFPSPAILVRFVVAAIVLAVVAAGIGSAGLLTCLAIGGIAGMFLWPALHELHRRSVSDDRSPAVARAAPYYNADLNSAASIDPALSSCILVAWFSGMLLTTPMYYPFPRLALPLLASIWLAAAGGVTWWMEATINVARRGDAVAVTRQQAVMKRLVMGMVLIAVAITVTGAGELRRPLVWQNRTSLRDASWHIASAVLQDVDGKYERINPQIAVPSNTIISPNPQDDISDEYDADATSLDLLEQKVVSPFDTTVPLADVSQPTCVVYAYGEPGVLGHLFAAGLNVGPVQDVGFPAASLDREEIPTYLIVGPNALRTPGMLNDWADKQYRFQHVADFHFIPSEVVLYNLFSAEWVGQHPECRVQKLELYRLK
ncbi:MAG: glycosyltransferase family 39 protein [Fuerstiella sp.]